MSNRTLNLVFESSKSRGVARLVLLAIADRSDDEGKAWCGTADIASRAAIARNHVIRHTTALSELGELEIGFRQGKNNTNLYRVLICPAAGQSQGGTVPPRAAACPTMGLNPSHHGTRTPRTPKNPKGKVEKFDPTSSELPFSSPAFSESWKTWCQHRKEKGHPLTPTTTRQQLAKLAAMGETRAIAAIDNSVTGGYQGIYEPKGNQAEKPRPKFQL